MTQPQTAVLGLIRELNGSSVDLEGTEIIVAGGRGVGGPEGFAPIKSLAEAQPYIPGTA